MHFPAGDKSTAPGAARSSQQIAGASTGWNPFEPLNPGFNWRAGVCGDLKFGQQDHMRNGKFYYFGTISKTYSEGSVIDIDLSIVGYHNGFVEFHICDVDKCGGEISEECFRTPGACHQLKREWTEGCQSGSNSRCGPIDQKNLGRWYLPCALHPLDDIIETFGDGAIRYRLPPSFHCAHCVLQWYWTGANSCNPPGLKDYYTGVDKPIGWGSCPGQSDAKGGYTDNMADCGGGLFSEEYLQCADIMITPA